MALVDDNTNQGILLRTNASQDTYIFNSKFPELIREFVQPDHQYSVYIDSTKAKLLSTTPQTTTLTIESISEYGLIIAQFEGDFTIDQVNGVFIVATYQQADYDSTSSGSYHTVIPPCGGDYYQSDQQYLIITRTDTNVSAKFVVQYSVEGDSYGFVAYEDQPRLLNENDQVGQVIPITIQAFDYSISMPENKSDCYITL